MASGLVFAKELVVDVGYGNIACKMWGKNTAATEKFLAFHGFQDNAGTYDPLMKLFLTNKRCIVCVEFPGHGLSSHLPRGIPYSPANDLQAMRAVVKQLGWTKYTLIGHSMGAARSQLYTLCWPDEVKTVVSLDGANLPLDFTYQGKDPFSVFAQQLDKSVRTSEGHHGKSPEFEAEELIDFWMAAEAGLTRDDILIQMRRGTTKSANGKYRLNRDPALHGRTNMVLHYPVDVLAGAIKEKMENIPHLIISSAAKILDPYLNALEEAHSGKLEIVKLEEGTHHFHLQQPQETADLINKFLLELSS